METKLYAKLIYGQPVTTCVPDDDPDMEAMILADGFKPYDDSAQQPVVGELQADVLMDPEKVTDLRSAVSNSGTEAKLTATSLSEPVPAYRDDGERIILEWQVLENSPTKIAAEIEKLKAELAATDYQVIKCSEYSLTKRKPPYDVSALHLSRQALRDRIGELEGLLMES